MSSWKLTYRDSAHTGKLVPRFNLHLLFFLASAGLIQCGIHCQHPQPCSNVWLIWMQIPHPFPVLLGFFQLTGLSMSFLFPGAQGIYEAVFRPRHWYILLDTSFYRSGPCWKRAIVLCRSLWSFIFWETPKYMLGFYQNCDSSVSTQNRTLFITLIHNYPPPTPEMGKPWASFRKPQSKVWPCF